MRKKVRGIRSAGQMLDLFCELETAYQLANERRLTVAYERYNADHRRGPDFTVLFKGRPVHLEVTHLHDGEADSPFRSASSKLHDAVCAKLGQCQSGAVNLLIVVADPQVEAALVLAEAMQQLYGRAAQKDDPFFAHRGLAHARGFLTQAQRLSGVLLRPLWTHAAAPETTVWLNPHARHVLPPELRSLLARVCAPTTGQPVNEFGG